MNLKLLKQASSLIKFAYNLQQQRAALNPAYSDYDQVYDHFYKENPNMAADNTAQYIVDNFGADPDQVYNYVENRQMMKDWNNALNLNFDQARDEHDQEMWNSFNDATQNYLNGLYEGSAFGTTPPKVPTGSLSYSDYKNFQNGAKDFISEGQNNINQNSNFLKGKSREPLRRFLGVPDDPVNFQQ